MCIRVVLVVCIGFHVLTARDAAGQSRQDPSDAPGFYAPDAVLAGYVMEALESNPWVQESLAAHRASMERVTAATALPDPMVSFTQALRSVETRVGPQLNTLALSQVFPWFGKLDLRGKVAVQEAAAAYQMQRTRQRDVIAQVKNAFYNLAYVDAALDITREEQSLLGHYEELAQARYASGQGLQHAVLKLQTEITNVVKRLDVLQQQRQTLAARLNSLMSRPPEQPLPTAKVPEVPPNVPLDLAQLTTLGDAARPEIQAADALIGRGEWAEKLAGKNFWPDLTLGAGFINVGKRGDAAGRLQPPPDNGKNAFTLTVGVSLPIHRDKLRADLRRATDELSAARLARAAAYNQMAFAVRDQIVRLQTLREQLRLVAEVLLPQTDEMLRATEAAYETGEVGVIDLLDSERSRLNVRLVHARDAADYFVALADLERAIGSPYPDTTRVP